MMHPWSVFIKKMPDHKKLKSKGEKGKCTKNCCKPSPSSFNFGNESLYCGFVAPNSKDDSLKNDPSNPKEVVSKPVENPETPFISTGGGIIDQNMEHTDKNDNVVKNAAVKNTSEPKLEIDNQQSLKPKPILNIEGNSLSRGEANLAVTCEGECCANIDADKSCTDANCSGCHGNHDSNVRCIFLGIAGVLVLAVIGYQSFIKMKNRRAKISKKKYSTDYEFGSIKV